MRNDERFSGAVADAVNIHAEVAGKSRSDLVRGTGMARATLDRSLDHCRPINTTELHAIARTLGVKASALLDEADERVAA